MGGTGERGTLSKNRVVRETPARPRRKCLGHVDAQLWAHRAPLTSLSPTARSCAFQNPTRGLPARPADQWGSVPQALRPLPGKLTGLSLETLCSAPERRASACSQGTHLTRGGWAAATQQDVRPLGQAAALALS